ncbi:MAG: hypothetical protein CFH01_01621, partial [Alphaproteobacteria bacterium MarineAlpha2_Bin1]
MSLITNKLKYIIFIFFLINFFWSPLIFGKDLPETNSAVHLGVKTCGNSTCHAAKNPWQISDVLQNEYITWSTLSRHSKAYKTLQGERSKRIAINLGFEDPTKIALCLSCHADNVPLNKRGTLFDINDGVGCESCHGGAENWLGKHVSGTGNHQDNLDLGMYPTDQLFAKATLCASCHVGNSKKSVIHRLYGAGHPRLVFELDTFINNQPAHFRVDRDYLLRKKYPKNTELWAVGQIINTKYILDKLSDINQSRDGLFPELSLFDCHACHRSVTDKINLNKPLAKKLGIPKINDSGIIMLGILSQIIAPELYEDFKSGPGSLHKATAENMENVALIAKKLNKSAESLMLKMKNISFDNNMNENLLYLLIESASNGLFSDFADAEQALMAIASSSSAITNNNSKLKK